MQRTTLCLAILLGAMLQVSHIHGQIHSVPWGKDGEKQMNVVFILADDFGWCNTELYGTTKLYKTPNISRLRKR
jgi:hypothetical protein